MIVLLTAGMLCICKLDWTQARLTGTGRETEEIREERMCMRATTCKVCSSRKRMQSMFGSNSKRPINILMGTRGQEDQKD